MARIRQKKLLLPLIGVLTRLTSADRIIILSHFDAATQDALAKVITGVLETSKLPFEKRLELRKQLGPHKKELLSLSDDTKSAGQKRKVLLRLGGGPMNRVLKTAVPLLLGTTPR